MLVRSASISVIQVRSELGGQGPSGNTSGVDRVDFSNDTPESPKGPLTLAHGINR